MSNSREVMGNWDMNKLISLFTKGTSDFSSLKACFNQTINILHNLIASLHAMNKGFSQESIKIQEVIKELIDQIQNYSEVFVKELIEPSEDFAEVYTRDTKELIERAQKIMKDVETEKEKIEGIKKQYFNYAQSLDKFQEKVVQGLDSVKESTVDEYKVKMRELRSITYSAYLNYSQAVANGNILLKDYEIHFLSIIASIEITEKNRNEYYKQTITKYLAHIDKLIAIYTQKAKLIKGEIQKIGLNLGLKAYFESLSQSVRNPFMPMVCDNYNFMSPTLEMANTNFDFPRKDPNEVNSLEDKEYFTIEFKCSLKIFFNKFNEGIIQQEEVKDILNHLSIPKDRFTFSLFLNGFNDNELILNETQYQVLLELCNHLMTKYLHEENPNTLNLLLEASRKIVVKTEEVKQPFYLQLVNHKIWQDIGIWKRLIDAAIKDMLANKTRKVKEKKGFLGTFKKAVTTNVSKLIPGSKGEIKEVTLEVLQQYCYYLSTSKIELRRVSELYKSYLHEFTTPKLILIDLVTKLMKCQKNPMNNIKLKDVFVNKFKKRCEKYETKGCFALSLAVEYINEKGTLRNMLLLSKYLYKMLRGKIFRQVLVKLNYKITLQQRLKIWIQILDIVSLFE